jgi:hypothetical protein
MATQQPHRQGSQHDKRKKPGAIAPFLAKCVPKGQVPMANSIETGALWSSTCQASNNTFITAMSMSQHLQRELAKLQT